MAEKTAKNHSIWGFATQSLLKQNLRPQPKTGDRRARVLVQGARKGFASQIVEGPDLIEVTLNPLAAKESESDARLKTPASVRIRDAVGGTLGLLEKMEVTWAEFELQLDAAGVEAALLGLELALYRFKRTFKGEPVKIGLTVRARGKAINDSVISRATALGVAANLARHLVNLPPNLLNPVTYATAAQQAMAGVKNVKVEVWDESKLAKEKAGLILAVGQGSPTPPRLVHIRYRPSGAAKKGGVAFVGKGITFDTGGVDIKPAAGMRLMKKDMGGSAAVLALAYWAAHAQVKIPLDFYLSMAENSVDGNSMRPGDIVIARNGTSVEIHNTDAEGRLVLADAMDVAVTQEPKPKFVVDVATLTGAIKVALGSAMAGLFANDAKLGQAIATAGQQSGDPAWVMPLMQRYRSQLSSSFADQINSSDGFGGAITAALFLEKFAREVPWAHLDIYAWKDSADGAFMEAGGSGQAVFALAQWLRGLR